MSNGGLVNCSAVELMCVDVIQTPKESIRHANFYPSYILFVKTARTKYPATQLIQMLNN